MTDVDEPSGISAEASNVGRSEISTHCSRPRAGSGDSYVSIAAEQGLSTDELLSFNGTSARELEVQGAAVGAFLDAGLGGCVSRTSVSRGHRFHVTR